MTAVPVCLGLRGFQGNFECWNRKCPGQKEMVAIPGGHACWAEIASSTPNTFFFHGVMFLSSQGHISQPPLRPGVATWLVLINGCHVSKSDSEAGASLLASLILPGCWHLRQPWECHALQMEEPLWTWVSGWLRVAKVPHHPHVTTAVGQTGYKLLLGVRSEESVCQQAALL